MKPRSIKKMVTLDRKYVQYSTEPSKNKNPNSTGGVRISSIAACSTNIQESLVVCSRYLFGKCGAVR